MNWHHIKAFSLRHMYPLKRDFDLLSDMLYWPIIDILLWGITSQWLVQNTGSTTAVATILTGLVFWNIIWRSQSEVSRNLMDEMWNNNLVNLFSTPLTLKEWVSGVLLLSLGKTLCTILLLVPIVLFLYSVNIIHIGLWLIPFFICTVVTGWAIGFLSAGIVIRWGPKVQTVIWTLPGILLPFSVVYFPLALLPTFLRPISYTIPTTYIFESIRSFLNTGNVNPLYIVISAFLAILYLSLSLVWFKKSFEKSLELGLGRFN